jgi:DNA-binding response OmpR family regulator
MADRILLIEDDHELSKQILATLRAAGFEPKWWPSGNHLAPGERATLSLIILDLMLPGTYGLDILKELRASGAEVPVLVLSARNETADKVRALKLGADDYMTKPFWPEELVARVRARLRRPSMQRGDALALGKLHVDLASRTVEVDGQAIELTRVEFKLLTALARRPGVALTRAWLAEHVLDPDREGSERTLDVHVSRLRKKLGGDIKLETVWGIGYRLEAGTT